MSWFTDAPLEEILAALPSLAPPQASPNVAQRRVVVLGGSIGGLAAAACLHAAGFSQIQVFERSSSLLRAGAGIGLDDASVAILKGLGALPSVALQRMRWTEERTPQGRVLTRQPLPYSAALYAEVQHALAALLPEGCVTYGRKATSAEVQQDGTTRVQFQEGPPATCDLLVAADGPRSAFRQHFGSSAMRFAGYFAWRGKVPMNELPERTQAALKEAYPDFGNCLYFVHRPEGGQHAVLYGLGNGLVNWLLYENRSEPLAGPGQTVAAAPKHEVEQLKSTARSRWGEGFGGVIEATPEPFVNDIYDLQDPLPSFANGSMAILGDAAHAITPHMAKGSNLALHDALALAAAAAGAADVPSMLQAYSEARTQECARCLLLSRHLGRVRSGLHPGCKSSPKDGVSFEALVRSSGLCARTLPTGELFLPVWDFLRSRLPESARGCFLRSEGTGLPRTLKRKADNIGDRSGTPMRIPPGAEPVQITCVNHISRETADVERLRRFYSTVLGLKALRRPDFGFGGAWLEIQPGIALHIIELDPDKPTAQGRHPVQDADLTDAGRLPERFIRRSHHVALTVPDIGAAKGTLEAHGVRYAENAVPGTSYVQLFFHDPDGNGVEIGNFDAML
mmetsp:Transcript_33473/g.94726  ORF Transcript_33473/g.94726 Transcript_33473/m.94726 type:complete len:623 (+) Transcript_33473:71-1939(+)|eukprot:CAMPEP_0177265852 /NCGR_PEP_ID=MMETSP0367-20130122/62349_1 /TAXON_ID=447022 ORGANISM="Scrippsiella hangoei-like, Strain SHHI-4" /NCGR_SAMPLE_ID=MMETSP0367 /ASSEMBLY_ACC=CAM_ASM_000362 /LENGTH=622 /DNA_ID=CAMNT_0018721137 /DNA_START=57 /DNA_END=1925 /DNA_ORIENTATION=+